MLTKLQKKTLVPIQVFGYFFSVLIGVGLILLACQLYFDLKPLLQGESNVFKEKTAVISKTVSLFKTANKEKLYFSDEEIQEIQTQKFVNAVSKFNNAGFKIKAFTKKKGEIPPFYTDMFFESIPDKYLDVRPEDWIWEEKSNFIPVIIPENYLNLYNFGFAESQGLPVVSKNTISKIQFNIRIQGNRKQRDFESRIVGFSSEINSILVPNNFLSWANKNYGRAESQKTSRLLLEFNNSENEKMIEFFNENNYNVNKKDLAQNKMLFFFNFAFAFVFFIALLIVGLSIAFVILSLNLIIQKNKTQIINLYNIGYGVKKIARFYQIFISVVSCISISLAMVMVLILRQNYSKTLLKLFDFEMSQNIILLGGFLLILFILLIYNLLLSKQIKSLVEEV